MFILSTKYLLIKVSVKYMYVHNDDVDDDDNDLKAIKVMPPEELTTGVNFML